jgi:phosphoribosylformylglycinamidine cyclo-ligase
MSHVTGGGLAANLERVLPASVTATVDRSTWSLPPVFALVRDTGDVATADLERTLNCGVGMVAVTAADATDRALEVLAGHGVDAWVAGEVSAATGAEHAGRAVLTGRHPA